MILIRLWELVSGLVKIGNLAMIRQQLDGWMGVFSNSHHLLSHRQNWHPIIIMFLSDHTVPRLQTVANRCKYLIRHLSQSMSVNQDWWWLLLSRYIQRQGRPETVQYANVVDGCTFLTRDPAVGCFQIWMTIEVIIIFLLFLQTILKSLIPIRRRQTNIDVYLVFFFFWLMMISLFSFLVTINLLALYDLWSHSGRDWYLDDWWYLFLEFVRLSFSFFFVTLNPSHECFCSTCSNNEQGTKTSNGPV